MDYLGGKANLKDARLPPMARSYISKRFLRIGTVAVAGDSMLPTYSNGDWLVARWARTFKVGQVLVIERQERPGIFLIKRLMQIDNENFWVEGDNSAASSDSREWGWRNSGEVLGRILFRYRKGPRPQ